MSAGSQLEEWTRFFEYWGHSPEQLAEDASRAAQKGLTAWDIAIFESIWYGYGSTSDQKSLGELAFGCYGDENPQAAAVAIQRSFDRRWIQVLDTPFITQKAAELSSRGTLLPNGLFGVANDSDPEHSCGLISFTPAGVDLYKSLLPHNSDIGHRAIELTEGGLYRAYGTTLDECEVPISDDYFRGRVVARRATETIGPWCDRWWNLFDSGYRVTFSVEKISSP